MDTPHFDHLYGAGDAHGDVDAIRAAGAARIPEVGVHSLAYGAILRLGD